MTSDLGFWMAMFTLGALAYFETPLGGLIRAGARALWAAVGSAEEADEQASERRTRRRFPIRRANGQLAGSFPSRSRAEPRSGDRSAPQSGGTTVTTVPIGTFPIPDMLVIAARLGSGTPPNEVAKSLPGYSGRRYGEYVERVRHVKAILDEHGALSPVEE